MTDHFHANADSDGNLYISGGRAVEFGYHGGTLAPSSRFSTEEELNRALRLVNLAYEEGIADARRAIRNALGMT